MFAHALPQGGLRPAEALPPTLIPNAIFSMAPPAPRAMGFLGACLVYATCGAGLMYAPAIVRPKPLPHTVSVIIAETATPMVTPVAAQQVLPTPRPGLIMKDAPARPEGWTPPISTDAVPLTPDTFPTIDNSKASVRAATAEDANRVALPPQVGTVGTSTSAQTVVEFDFQQMRVLQRVDPVYPAMAKLAHIQGEVVLLMAVDPRGVPTEVRALSGPHVSLQQEAMRVARLWRFEPATLNGQPVSAQFRLTINFRLK